jgi:hypothetical protein
MTTLLTHTGTELRVAIVDEEAERLLAIIERHQEVARLLGGYLTSSTTS